MEKYKNKQTGEIIEAEKQYIYGLLLYVDSKGIAYCLSDFDRYFNIIETQPIELEIKTKEALAARDKEWVEAIEKYQWSKLHDITIVLEDWEALKSKMGVE